MDNLKDTVSDKIGGPARQKVIFLLACVLALQSADLGTTGAVATQLQRTFNLNNEQIGLLVAVTLFAAAVATLPFGMLVDRINRTHLLAATIGVWCLAIVAVGFSSSYLMLVITRIILGAVTASALPAIASLTGDFFPGRERATVYGYILGGELVGAGIGYLVSGNLVTFASWRLSFWWLVLPGAILAWALWALLPEPARGGQSHIAFEDEHIRSADEAASRPGEQDRASQQGRESIGQRAAERKGVQPHPDLVLDAQSAHLNIWQAVRYVLRVRTNVILIIASALGYSFFEAVRTLGLLFARGHFGLGQSESTFIILALGVGALIGVLGSGHLSNWLARHGHLNARILVPAVAFVLCAVTFGPGIYSTTLWVSIPLFMLGALALAASNPPMDAARLDVVPGVIWGRAESVRTVFRSVVEGASPLVVGFLADRLGNGQYSSGQQAGSPGGAQGLEYALLIALIPLVLAAVVLFFARGSYAPDAVTAAESDRRVFGQGQPEQAGRAPRPRRAA